MRALFESSVKGVKCSGQQRSPSPPNVGLKKFTAGRSLEIRQEGQDLRRRNHQDNIYASAMDWSQTPIPLISISECSRASAQPAMFGLSILPSMVHNLSQKQNGFDGFLYCSWRYA